ncbi:PAS domain S-box protein [Mariprofundus erugo]|uniref:histidine kinase n=1 Tax=Mariprofundus erugo TaxID=2528639 RepID=A0A5R9GMD7_9PROT|nr:PAS domain S-box protein [Mariprofundus erugo]TLS67230.1 PAS domain S-box protein [Mariprofundus erugo]
MTDSAVLNEGDFSFDLNEFFQNSPDMILIIGLEGYILYANAAAERCYGYHLAELTSMHVRDLAAPDLRSHVSEKLRDAIAIPTFFEWRHRRKDGSELPVEIFAQPIFFRGEKARLASIRDISERSQAHAALRKSEARFRAYMEQAAEAVFAHDFQGRFLDVNREACESLGYSHDELLSMSVMDIDENFDLARARTFWGGIDPGQTVTVQGKHRRKDGSSFPVEIKVGCFDFDGERRYLVFVRDISERELAHAALTESENIFRSIFEQAAVGVAQVHSRSGRFVRINQKYCDIVGYSRAEMEKLDFQTITHPDDLTEDMENMARLIAGEVRQFHMQKRYYRKDGRLTWVNLSVSALWKEGDAADFHLAIVEDITASKQLQTVLQLSEEKYRTLFENMLNGFAYHELVTDSSGKPVNFRFLEVNQAFERLTGLKREAVEGRLATEVIPGIADDPADWIGRYGRVVLSGEGERFESYSEPLGRWYTVFCFRTSPGHFATTFDDLTERKQSELRLQESRQLLAETEQVGHLGGWSFDIDSAAWVWTDEVYRIYDVGPDFVPTPDRVFSFCTAASRQQAKEAFQALVKQGTPLDIELELVTAAGKHRYVRSIGRLDREHHRAYGFIQDITELKELESQFRQAQKMEAIGTLVGGIAHDFNNMLAAIMGNLYLARGHARGNQTLTGELGVIQMMCERAADMIRQLLTFARRDSIAMQKIALSSFLKEAMKLTAASVPEDMTLSFNFPRHELWVDADITQLQQVLMNLVNNARDALKDRQGGEIHCSLKSCRVDAAFRSRHPQCEGDRFARLSVQDNGCGIPTSIRENIFDPFFTTKEVGKGTGLGLAMVYGAIQGHHGVVEVESDPHRGTRFDVYLPLSDQQSEEQGEGADAVVSGQGELILVADDSQPLLDMYKQLLESLGYRVLLARHGDEAVALYRQYRDDIALVMLDLVMPLTGGVEAARRIRQMSLNTPIIFATGYDSEEGLRQSTSFDHSQLLAKPVSVELLSRAIQSMLNR